MAAMLPQDIAAQLKYGAQTGTTLRRSQYLADALKDLTSQGGQNIRSPWELGTKLLAEAILSKAGKRADHDALQSIIDNQNSETSSTLAGLGGLPPLASPSPAPAPLQPAPQPQATPTAPVNPGVSQAAPNVPGNPYSPQDHDALVRMIATEAGGEGPVGMAAAAHVAVNRLKNGYGNAKSLRDVIFQPHQFEGVSRFNQVEPQAYGQAAQVADAVLSGQAPDPTGGAMAFLNPQLQTQLGRQIPQWAQGQGQRIGNHIFFGGQQSQPPPAPPPSPAVAQSPGAPEPQMAPQPFQLAAAQLQPGMMPSASAPGLSPPAPGGPPAAPNPQAQAAAGGAPSRITPEQLAFVEKLLRNPQTHDVGMAYAMELQKKAAEPTKYETQNINGVPSWLDPEHPGVIQTGPVPQAAMTQTLDAHAAGLPNAPGGLYVQRDPTGNLKDAPGGPPVGYQSSPGGGLQYQPGGPADPTRQQPAPQGYQYASPTQQQPIQGGPADPRAPQNLAQGVMAYKKDLDPIVTSAMKVRQNYGAVTTGYRQQNGTGDIAMINGLQKLIDEGVVKGEDVTMQMKSNGLDGTLGGYSQYLSSGGLLNPEIRQKVFKTASDLYQNLDQTYRARVLSMKPAVDELYGPGAFDKFIFPQEMSAQMGWSGGAPQGGGSAPPQPMPTSAMTAGTRDAAIAEARRRGLIH